VNLRDHPGLECFYERLRKIRSREDVADVLVNIHDLDNIIVGEENAWPFTENVHILTRASEATVEGCADELRSNGAIEGWPYGRAKQTPEARPFWVESERLAVSTTSPVYPPRAD